MGAALVFGSKERQLVYRVALRVLKAPDQAEDAAQDALLNAYSARHTFEGRASPEAWLYRIAYNTALSHARRPFARRFTSTDVFALIDEQASAESPLTTPWSTLIARRLAASLVACLSAMSHNDRLAFTERFVRGTSERELGAILGVTPNAAKQRAFRARRAVRLRMATQHAPDL